MESIIGMMTSEGGHKMRCLMKLNKWSEALSDAMNTREVSLVLELYEAARQVPNADEDVKHVENTARQFLARNAMRQ